MATHIYFIMVQLLFNFGLLVGLGGGGGGVGGGGGGGTHFNPSTVERKMQTDL